MLLPTSLVGSYPQPGWLIDRAVLSKIVPPRSRASELWRVDEAFLREAQDDATILAIRDQEQAGLDIVTDGEVRRESYSNYFTIALGGLDIENPVEIPGRTPGRLQIAPRVVGKIERTRQVEFENVKFLRKHTDRQIKVTLPGPFTMSQQLYDEHYRDEAALAFDCAVAINEEIRDAFAAGADVVQIDEPFLQARPDKAQAFGVEVINRAVEGADGTTALHICFGYGIFVKNRPVEGYSFLAELEDSKIDQISIETAQSNLDCSVLAELPSKTIILGVIGLADLTVESPELVAERIRRALPHVDAERIVIAPDCGMKYLPREIAVAKMSAMVGGAKIVRAELGGR